MDMKAFSDHCICHDWHIMTCGKSAIWQVRIFLFLRSPALKDVLAYPLRAFTIEG